MFELHPQLEKDCEILGDLPLCRVLLMNDRQYPWFILVPRVAGITEIFQLAAEDRARLIDESCRFSEFIHREFSAHKINVAALGNMVPQLHVHHIVRYREDPAWPGPVWGKLPAVPYAAGAADEVARRVAPLF